MKTAYLSLALALLAAGHAAAQDDDSLAAEHPPLVSFGTSAGTLRLQSGRTEQAVSAILQLQPAEWLTLAVTPTFAHAGQTANKTLAVNGLTDLALDAGVSHTFDAPMSPSLGVGLSATLPTGDTLKGLGSGTTSFGLDVGAGISPFGGLDLSGSVSIPLTTDNLASALSANNGGTLDLEAGYALLPRLDASVGFSSDLAAGDSATTPARSLAGGLALGIAGPLTLTVDGSTRISGDAPTWSLTVGFGTAFAGLSPIGPTSPLRRLKHVFSRSGKGRGNGRGKNAA